MKTSGKSIGAVLLALVATSGLANAQTRIRLNGQPFRTAVAPVTENGRVLVPMRAIFEALGANVTFFPRDASIIARRDGTVVRMNLGSPRASVNGDRVRLDVPATAYSGRTLVPLRFVSEAMGASVDYDSYRQLVSIEDGHSGNGGPLDGEHRFPRDRDRNGDGIRDGVHDRNGDGIRHDDQLDPRDNRR